MVEKISEAEAMDKILEHCLKNKQGITSHDLHRHLFPTWDRKVIDFLIEKIDDSSDFIAIAGRGNIANTISATGMTENFLKEGGFTKIEKDKILSIEKEAEKEALELEKTKVDLILAKETLKELRV